MRVHSVVLGAAGYAVAAAVVVALLCSFLLVPLLGAEYVAAQSLVIPLCAAAAVFGVSQILITLLIAGRRNKAASATEAVGFVASVAAYIVLIGWYDAVGAAFGSLLGYCASLMVAGVVVLLTGRHR